LISPENTDPKAFIHKKVFPGVKICELGKNIDTLTRLAGVSPQAERLNFFSETPAKAPEISIRRFSGKTILKMPIKTGENINIVNRNRGGL